MENTNNLWRLVLCVIFFSSCWMTCQAFLLGPATQCLNHAGAPVDWFVAYKLPQGIAHVPTNSYLYMDVQQTTWQMAPNLISDPGQAVYNTMQQIYHSPESNKSVKASELMYAMYNDEPPVVETATVVAFGHTKGVIAFDSLSGFWLVHSTPHFSSARKAGYIWPSTAERYGQSFLCISMATASNMDEIGKQLLYNYPHIYDQSFPASFASNYPNMAAALAHKHITQAPWNRETTLHSLAGVEFHSFAKFSSFNRDLYADWLASRFSAGLLVETWMNGANPLCSNCTGNFKVYNINQVNFHSPAIAFKQTHDHSKWAVTNSTSSLWTCVGDINRMESQMRRSGGTVCFQNSAVWTNFHSIVDNVHQCGTFHQCVNP